MVRLFGPDGNRPGHDLASDIARAWPEAEIHTCGPGSDFDAAVVWAADPAELVAFVACQTGPWWLHTTAAGVDASVAAAVRGRNVTVTNGSGGHGPAVAEHVLAVLLAHYKRLPFLQRRQRERAWAPDVAAEEIAGKTIGIIGLGDLGRCTARLLAALDVTVVGLRRRPIPPPAGVSVMSRPDQMEAFLTGLDALVVAVPLTDATRGLIGAAEIAALPAGAYLVNVGRGPIVVQDALVAALRSGHLAGAALDVFAEEPLPASSVLWTLPTVTITPHCADRTAGTDGRCLDLLLDNIRRFRSGHRLRSVLDLRPGC